jgi:hypothetical protein
MLFTKEEVAILIYGYYFVAFGLLGLMEILLMILFNGKTFRHRLIDLLSYDEDDDNKKVIKSTVTNKPKKVNSKRIVAKVKVDDDYDEVKVVEKKSNKSKKNKKINK